MQENFELYVILHLKYLLISPSEITAGADTEFSVQKIQKSHAVMDFSRCLFANTPF